MPEELWMEVCDTVQEAVIKDIPRKRNVKKQNGYLRRPYKLAVKRRDAKSKGEKERYTNLKAELKKKNSKER